MRVISLNLNGIRSAFSKHFTFQLTALANATMEQQLVNFDNSLKNQAIQAALQGDWNNATLLNQQILQEEPENIASKLMYIVDTRKKNGKYYLSH